MEEAREARRPRWWGRVALLIAGIVVVTTIPGWGPRVLAEMSFFRLRRVQVVGARYVSADSIVALLGVDTTRSIWDETDELRARAQTSTGERCRDLAAYARYARRDGY